MKIAAICILIAMAVLGLVEWVSRRREAAARRSGLLPASGRATMLDVERLVKNGEKIWAIRCYREIRSCGLAEAKQAVEEMSDEGKH